MAEVIALSLCVQVAGSQARSCHRASVGPLLRYWIRQVTVRGDSAQAIVQGFVGAEAKCNLAPCIDHIEPC